MKNTRQEIGTGDAVEVLIVSRLPAKPGERPVEEKWLPATVVNASRNEIGVAFSDGERLALQRFSNKWRPA
jgi:hypothetical protein